MNSRRQQQWAAEREELRQYQMGLAVERATTTNDDCQTTLGKISQLVGEEREAVQARGRAAGQTLVTRHLPWVRGQAARHARRWRACADELTHEAVLGLYEAMARFDVRRDGPFPAFAIHWVRKYLLEWRRRTHGAMASNFTYGVREGTVQYVPTTWRGVRGAEQREAARRPAVSLQAEEATPELEAALATPGLSEAEQALQRRELIACLTHYMSELTDVQQAILAYRFGLQDNQEHTLEQTAAFLGMSREWTRRQEKAALAQLREHQRLRDCF